MPEAPAAQPDAPAAQPAQPAAPAAQPAALNSFPELIRHLKLGFPRFDGSNPRAWENKCDKFFRIFPADDLDKVRVASLCFDGKADAWFFNYHRAKPLATWRNLVDDICLHFEDFEDVNQGNYVGNFNKLTQSGSVDDYFTQFDKLKSYMLTKYPTLPNEYFVSSFLSGLKDDIRSQVQMLRPKSLSDAFSLARLQEGIVDRQHPKSKFFLSAIPTGIRFATSTMVILLLAGIAWWVVGLYWIISGRKELMDDAPLLFWLTAVLLGMGAALGAALLFCVFVYMLFGAYFL